jgi:hypothetical protein
VPSNTCFFHEVLNPGYYALTMPVKACAKAWSYLVEKVLEDKESSMLIYLQPSHPLRGQLGVGPIGIQLERSPTLHPEYRWIVGCRRRRKR